MKKLWIVALLIFAGPLSYGQQMSVPVNISNSVHDSRWAQCAFGPDSVLYVVWYESYIDRQGSDILLKSYDGKTWTGPIKIKDSPDVHAERPYVGTNKKGMIAVVWDSEHYIFCRIFDPETKTWLPAEMISGDMEWPATEPAVGLDEDGNVFVFYYTAEPGYAWARSKINGGWEPLALLSDPGYRAQHGTLAVGPDGTAWAVWIEKGDDGYYKNMFSKRTKSTPWRDRTDVNLEGGSQAVPHMAIGKDNIPRVVYMEEIENVGGGGIFITMCTMDGKTHPQEMVAPLGLQHFPRIAMDSNDVPHVAIQDGPGDFGGGITYTDKSGGFWKSLYNFPFSAGHPKLPGIAADAYGNVAVVWESFYTTPQKEVWVSTLYPVVAKNFLPPVNLSVDLSISKVRKQSSLVYTLKWQPNPDNLDQYLSGYNIYQKDASGNWALLLNVTKGTTTSTFTFADLSVRRHFGIRTVAQGGAMSSIVPF